MGALDFVLGTDAAYLPMDTSASEFSSSALIRVSIIFPGSSPVLVKIIGIVGETSKVRNVAEINLIL